MTVQHAERRGFIFSIVIAVVLSAAALILGIATGTFLASLGLHLLHAAHAVTGGTAGLSLLLGYATGWPFWALFTLINVPFALLAVWRRGDLAASLALVPARLLVRVGLVCGRG